MSNSSLVDCKMLSPNHSGKRTHSIDRITPHCVVGQLSAEGIGRCFDNKSREASCNYGIGNDGRVILVVDEANRSWCSSNRDNDQRAVTIECASDKSAPYTFNNAVYAKLVELCVDICKRNGKTKLLWLGDKDKTLAYNPAANEMVLTVHRWFANKSCPGDWMYQRMGDLASQVNAKLNPAVNMDDEKVIIYRVQTGAFSKKNNARTLVDMLKEKGYETYAVKNNGMFKVQVGAFSKLSNATAMSERLKADGFDAFITTTGGTAVSL